MDKNKSAIFQAIMAAVCYGISAPLSKILLTELAPVFMAALLYLGAGAGMLAVRVLKHDLKEARITRKEWPYTFGMIILDIAAPIFLMLGLTMTTSANAALLNNFEIVATALIALLIFKEAVGRRMWIAIVLITAASIILSFEGSGSFSFSVGSVFILAACISWGLENNCTRMLSLKDPLQIVILKGFGSGTGSLIIAFILSEVTFNIKFILLALLLGFIAYGLSIFLYILAQRQLGAARTSAYYAFAPFIGVGLSFIVFKQNVTFLFTAALAIMSIGAYFASFEKHNHHHIHEELKHDHRHNHSDEHHNHIHDAPINGDHSHVHTHQNISHTHKHTPDLHHTHLH